MSTDHPARSDHGSAPYLALRPPVEKVLVQTRTSYQELILAQSCSHGKCLFLDGEIQSAQADEFIYHEALVHPALLAHSRPEEVLIIGGGEGATLREVLRHGGVRKVTMVDIDRELVEFARRHLPEWHQGSFSDNRCEVIFADARAHLSQTSHAYDVVISDLSSPLEGGPAWHLYTLEFYTLLKSRLQPEGILALQAGCGSADDADLLGGLLATLKGVFQSVSPYREFIPSFEDAWSFLVSSDGCKPEGMCAGKIDSLIASRIAGELRFYDGITHEGMFRIPKHLRQVIDSGEIITDSDPVFSDFTSRDCRQGARLSPS